MALITFAVGTERQESDYILKTWLGFEVSELRGSSYLVILALAFQGHLQGRTWLIFKKNWEFEGLCVCLFSGN